MPSLHWLDPTSPLSTVDMAHLHVPVFGNRASYDYWVRGVLEPSLSTRLTYIIVRGATTFSFLLLSFFPVNGSCSSHTDCLVFCMHSRSSLPPSTHEPPVDSPPANHLASAWILWRTCRVIGMHAINGIQNSRMDVRKAGEPVCRAAWYLQYPCPGPGPSPGPNLKPSH